MLIAQSEAETRAALPIGIVVALHSQHLVRGAREST